MRVRRSTPSSRDSMIGPSGSPPQTGRDRPRTLSWSARWHPDRREGSHRRRGHRDDVGIGGSVREVTTDAPAIARLRKAGAIIIGKTNLHEFAFGTTSEESAFGPVRNPLDPSRSAGGSSGGSAAALAAGMCFGALGTDTGGSIRIPSAACGTVGLKPTLDEISCDGVIPLSTTLDHLGPMARSVDDTDLIFEASRDVRRVLAPAH